jgi:hypothetical protein
MYINFIQVCHSWRAGYRGKKNRTVLQRNVDRPIFLKTNPGRWITEVGDSCIAFIWEKSIWCFFFSWDHFQRNNRTTKIKSINQRLDLTVRIQQSINFRYICIYITFILVCHSWRAGYRGKINRTVLQRNVDRPIFLQTNPGRWITEVGDSCIAFIWEKSIWCFFCSWDHFQRNNLTTNNGSINVWLY